MRMNPRTLWLTIKCEIRVVVGLILRSVSALAQARKGVLNLCPVFGLREIFLFLFFSFRVRFIAIWLVITDGLWSLGSLIVIPYIGWKTVDCSGMTRMLLLGKHYQKFESFHSCDTFIPVVYRKSTKHIRWDQIAKIEWRIHQEDVSG